MQITLPLKNKIISLTWARDLFDILLFLFFFTLHADRLSLALAGSTFRVNNAIALILIIILSARFRKTAFTLPRALLAAWLCLTLSMVISTFLSIDRGRSLFFLLWYAITAIAYFFLPYYLVSLYDERRILKSYFLSFVFVALYGALQLFFSFFGIIDPCVGQLFGPGFARPNAFSYEPSYLSLYLTPFMILVNGHFLLNREADPKISWKMLISINVLYFLTLTSSTVLAFLLFLLMLTIGPFRKYFPQYKKALKKAYALFFGVSIGFSLLFPSLSKELLFKFFYQGIFHHSFYERGIGIANSFLLFLKHPFFGVGLGNIPQALFAAWREQESGFIFFVKEDLLFQAVNPLKYFEPSNVLTEILGTLGIFGLIAFFFLFITYFRQVKRALTLSISFEDKEIIFLFFISTVVMLLLLQLSQGLFRTYIWAHFAISYSLTNKIINK